MDRPTFEGIGWAFVGLLEDGRLTPAARLVFVALTSLAAGEKPTLKTLMRRTGLSTSAVRAGYKALHAAGHLTGKNKTASSSPAKQEEHGLFFRQPAPDNGEVSKILTGSILKQSLAHFCGAWEVMHDRLYKPTPADCSNLSRLLKSGTTAAEWATAVQAYLADTDPFVVRRGHDLKYLVSNFNRYSGGTSARGTTTDRPHPAPRLAGQPQAPAGQRRRGETSLAAADPLAGPSAGHPKTVR